MGLRSTCSDCPKHKQKKPHRLSESGINHLIDNEGFKNKLYKDSAGLPTIGVGHLLTRSELSSGKIVINGRAVKYRHGLTDTQVKMLLRQDLPRYENSVKTHVTVVLNQHQFDALVSFCFNVGTRAFKQSTLLKRVNAGRFDDVPAQFRCWVYAGGKKSRGLANRRKSEIAQWQGIA